MKELRKGGRLQQHQQRLEEKKVYDRLEEKYISQQKLKNELGTTDSMIGEDYESSGSDEEAETEFKGLNLNQLRFLMRRKLVRNNFDESKLEPVHIFEPVDNGMAEEPEDSQADIENEEEGRK